MIQMLYIAVCDDDEALLEEIASGVEVSMKRHYDRSFKIFKFNNGRDLLEVCQGKKIDVIFLDISMPEVDGFKTAENLLKFNKFMDLIFVSSNETMVYSSYEYHPFWFIPKAQLSMLDGVVSKLVTKIKAEELEDEPVKVKLGNLSAEIDLKEVTYFMNEDHYIRYFYKDSSASESSRCKLNDIEEQLAEYYFVRCHNRYLVNCRMISYIDKTTCILKNNEKIPISRSCLKQTKESFQEYSRCKR